MLKGKTSLEDNVFLSRKVPLKHDDETELGVILVYIERESAVVWQASPKMYKKTMTLTVAIVKSLNPDDVEEIEDQLEDITEEVENIIEKNDTLDDTCSECDFQGYEAITNEEGEFKEGAVKLTYSIVYYEEVGLDEDDLNEFNQSTVKIKNNDHANDFSFKVDHQS